MIFEGFKSQNATANLNSFISCCSQQVTQGGKWPWKTQEWASTLLHSYFTEWPRALSCPSLHLRSPTCHLWALTSFLQNFSFQPLSLAHLLPNRALCYSSCDGEVGLCKSNQCQILWIPFLPYIIPGEDEKQQTELPNSVICLLFFFCTNTEAHLCHVQPALIPPRVRILRATHLYMTLEMCSIKT